MRETRPKKHAGSRRHRSVAEAEAILERYFESGLTQRVFAERNGVSVSSLGYWLRRARSTPQAISGKSSESRAGARSLLEVELAAPTRRSMPEARLYEIELPGGERLRVSGGFDAEEVRRLLALLGMEGR